MHRWERVFSLLAAGVNATFGFSALSWVPDDPVVWVLSGILFFCAAGFVALATSRSHLEP